MRSFPSLISLYTFAFSCIALAACSYQLPTLDTSNAGGSGGSSVNGSSSSTGGFGGATAASSSSSAAESSSSSSSSSSGAQMLDVCGDGIIGTTEQCDDNNNRVGDGCDNNCQIENHDHCDGPVLELGIGSVDINSTTAGATDDINRSATVEYCGAGDRLGPDLIYAIKPSFDGSLKATLNAKYTNHYLHIRKVCPGQDSDEIGCDWASDVNSPDVSNVPLNNGEILYVIVDGHLMDSGPFALNLTAQ